MILDKAIHVKLLCCSRFASVSFKRGESKRVDRFEKALKYLTLIMFAAEVLVTAIDLFLSKSSR